MLARLKFGLWKTWSISGQKLRNCRSRRSTCCRRSVRCRRPATRSPGLMRQQEQRRASVCEVGNKRRSEWQSGGESDIHLASVGPPAGVSVCGGGRAGTEPIGVRRPAGCHPCRGSSFAPRDPRRAADLSSSRLLSQLLRRPPSALTWPVAHSLIASKRCPTQVAWMRYGKIPSPPTSLEVRTTFVFLFVNFSQTEKLIFLPIMYMPLKLNFPS